MSETIINSGEGGHVPEQRTDAHGNVHDRVTGWTILHTLPGPDGQRIGVDPPIFIAPAEGSILSPKPGQADPSQVSRPAE